ncbi:hypothetical protein BT63DRAFT_381689 [Microthyrium microscopicum]|uniref:Outer spore wall protein RRT8 n=1 Tax=Microthyrium microscopicum TaxID=703497 RepID=A0A6A6UT49_9PEZI|nr:hypothetical protein BT63DRAFT_381689 [Microthyrium microscopicum]
MSQRKSNTVAGNIANRAKDVVSEDANKAKALLTDAVKSRAYFYPIKGIYYFLSHQSLWQPLREQLLPTFGTAMSVTLAMFAFTYLPQAAILTLVNGPLAFISTILLVLSESATITNIIARGFFIDEALLDTFDGTLLSREKPKLVSQGRQLKPARSGAGNTVSRLGKVVSKRFARFTPSGIIRYLVYLPLNMIPVVGTVLFIVLQARRFGPNAHARYFQLKGWSNAQREDYIEKKRAAYTAFGAPAVLLEMIPFIGVGFAFTNTVGAALWAADMEDGMSAPETAELREDEMGEQESGVVRDEGKKEL